jgi:hypothetical protein
MQNVCFGAIGMGVAFPFATALTADGHHGGAVNTRPFGPPMRPCAGQRKLG